MLIDKQRFMDDLMNCSESIGRKSLMTMIDVLYSQPAVEAEPVVHSKWKYYHKKGIAVCMNCSFERHLDDDFGRAIACPNCGAKMDGGNQNE